MKRYWEIDFLRGIAVIMMIVFHLLFDLDYFNVFSFSVHSGFLFWFARATAVLFILLVGISLAISHNRALEEGESAVKKFFLRGAKIFGYGLIITIATWLAFPKETIVFGVLHFIGISIILAIPFLKWKWKNIALAVPIITAGIFLQGFYFNFPWLLWLGFLPKGFYTFDYFPLLPWFGIVLIGIFLGNTLYPAGKRIFAIAEFGKKIAARQLCWLGRHSLLIYFLHQPVLIAVVIALKGF